ncbi:actin depolymerizing protein [Hesseltinella vesiculosa]|uniref:Actin depolymerizing protein n=1 Tax=Hesseltinella vesiculosa TaxID=101127 RepID=A0A1X2GGA6_9FUNG|nr:actin depolymerizing protein [Hesseltinella vesiculosa]
MLKNSTWKLEETNLVNFGSDLEKQHRKEEGALETAWNYEGSVIGHQQGFWIWRVQAFNLIKVPETQFGQFYQGDSYVLLKSTQKKDSDALVHNVHFWLGRETSQDEAGTAAYKTVELDDFLDSLATQHREVQRHESSLFKSYFKSLTYLQGGFASGFNHVEKEELRTRLLRVHRPSSLDGTHTQNAVVISEVPTAAGSLNAQAVFVLDTGDVVYAWQGQHARGVEKAKAAEFIAQLISERNGKGSMVVIEQNAGGQKAFWDALGEAEQDVQEEDSDEDLRKDEGRPKSLLRLHANMLGKLKLDEVCQGKLSKKMLSSEDVYLVDATHQVFVWMGSNASRKERRFGLHYAQEYLKSSGLPPYTPICQLLQGGEDELFESQFEEWQGW